MARPFHCPVNGDELKLRFAAACRLDCLGGGSTCKLQAQFEIGNGVCLFTGLVPCDFFSMTKVRSRIPAVAEEVKYGSLDIECEHQGEKEEKESRTTIVHINHSFSRDFSDICDALGKSPISHGTSQGL